MSLTESEYQTIKPHREAILSFKESGKYRGGEMILFDQIRQRKGHVPTRFDCDGCKVDLLLDIYNMLIEYEGRKIKN